MNEAVLPEDITEYLQTLLNIAVQVADLQYDDTSREGIIAMVELLADHFDIPCNYVEIEVDEQGTTTARTIDPTDDPGTVH